MTKTKRLKLVYKRLQRYSSILGIIGIILTVSFFIINRISSQHALQLAESFRDALSRSLEDVQKGGKAHPYRTPYKWAVAFEKEPKLQIDVGLSCTVTVIRGNSTEG